MIIMTIAVAILIRIDHEIRLQSIQATSRTTGVKKKVKKVKKIEVKEDEND